MAEVLNAFKRHFPAQAQRPKSDCAQVYNGGISNDENSDCCSITNRRNGYGSDGRDSDCKDKTITEVLVNTIVLWPQLISLGLINQFSTGTKSLPYGSLQFTSL